MSNTARTCSRRRWSHYPQSHTHGSRMSTGCSATFMYLFVCLFVFQHDTSKTDAAIGSPNLTQKCSTLSPGNPFILKSKVKQCLFYSPLVWGGGIRHFGGLLAVFNVRCKNVLGSLGEYKTFGRIFPLQMPTINTEGQRSRHPHETQKTLPAGSWRSCGCWLLPVYRFGGLIYSKTFDG